MLLLLLGLVVQCYSQPRTATSLTFVHARIQGHGSYRVSCVYEELAMSVWSQAAQLLSWGFGDVNFVGSARKGSQA